MMVYKEPHCDLEPGDVPLYALAPRDPEFFVVSMTLAKEGESEMTEEVQAGAGSEEEGKSRGAFQGIFRHLRFGERVWPISIPK